ncbi:hypothetical protein ElyMa_002928900 [Elysia marginata]|uniref:Uncharacterized protein n=1 Tax=Elysia marginata TaxID=1093978 RepID=A0AAV4I6I7_9GAST|nr:hypothetical protein ElyMa_002928900 [Elysia marginata]
MGRGPSWSRRDLRQRALPATTGLTQPEESHSNGTLGRSTAPPRMTKDLRFRSRHLVDRTTYSCEENLIDTNAERNRVKRMSY